MNTLRTYLVVEGHSGGDYVKELSLPGYGKEEVVRDLIDCQWEEPKAVFFIDSEAGICREVSAEIAEEIIATAQSNDLTLHEIVVTFCERALSPFSVPSEVRRAA